MKKYLSHYIHALFLFLALFATSEVKAWEPDYNSSKNLWKYVDQIAETDKYQDVATPDGEGPKGEVHHQQGSHTWTFKTYEDAAAAWKVYCHIYSGGIYIKSSSTYHLAMKVKADGDVSGFRWKAENSTGSTTRYAYEEARALKANEECLIKVSFHGTHDGSDLDQLRLGVDMYGAKANTTLTISEIYLEEVDGDLYNSVCNPWKNFDMNYAPGENIDGAVVTETHGSETVSHTKGSSEWKITRTGNAESDKWSSWVHINPRSLVKVYNANWYDVNITLRSNKDVKIQIKLEQAGASGRYLIDQEVSLKANKVQVLRKRFHGTSTREDITASILSVGVGLAANGTEITMSDIVICEAGADYGDSRNLWQEVDRKSTYYTPTAAGEKVSITHEPESRHWDINLKQAATSWSSWINILSGIPIKHSSNYCLYAVICSDHDIPNAKMKLEKYGDSSSAVLSSSMNIKANQPYFFKWDFATSYGTSLDFDDMSMSVDFEGAPAGTNVCIHDIYFAEQEDWKHDAAENKWKNTAQRIGDDHRGFSEPSYNSTTKEWTAQTTATTESDWQGAFRIIRDVTVTAGREYDFYATIMVDKDISGARMRIAKAGAVTDSLFYTDPVLNLKAYTPYIFKIAGKKANFSATQLELCFTVGTAYTGTNVKIKNIYLAEHEEFAINKNERKYYHIRAIAADGTSLGYLDRNFMPSGDSKRGYLNIERYYKAKTETTPEEDKLFINSIDGHMSFFAYGNTFKDEATGKYFQRDDLDHPLSSPMMQTYNAFNGVTEGADAKMFPQLQANTNEKDIEWTATNTWTENGITGSYSQQARRNCIFEIYKESVDEKGNITCSVRFILRDKKVQDNIRPMAHNDKQRTLQSEFTGKGTTWEHPFYLTIADGVRWMNLSGIEKTIYPTTDYAKAIKLVLEPADRPEIVLDHYVGYTYDTEAKEHPTGDIPEELLYGNDATDHDYYKRHDDDPRINEGADPIQRTHELVKEVWVVPGEQVELLPFSDFKDPNRTHYHETYVRWYDYRTGKHPLKSDGTTTTLDTDKLTGSTYFHRSQQGAFGGGELTGNRVNAASMLYKSTAGSTEDVLDIIAVDASQTYYNASHVTEERDGKLYMKEPNIAFRIVFIIRNAALRADANDTYLKNLDYVALHKEKLIAPEGTPFQYRLPYAEVNNLNATSYPTGYVYKDGSGKYQPIYHYLVETWKSENGTRKERLGVTRVPDGTTMFETADGITKKDLAITAKPGTNGENRVLYIQDPKAGEYKIMVFALDNSGNVITIPGTTEWLQLMEFDLTVLPKDKGNMILRSELLSNADLAHQRPEEMEKLYGGHTTMVNFDDVKENTTTSTTKGYYMWPRKWEESSYAFGYDNRHDYNMYVVANHSTVTPYHAGADATEEYHDILALDTEGAQQGYFYYTNAAGDPGRMTILNIGKDLCPRTTVYVSAWVKEFSQTTETANVVFSFKGIDKDGYETTLSSFATGYVTGGNNTLPDGSNPDNRGLWHHVYYSFHSDNIPAGKVFDHFIISVENNCVNSGGADYAIDDIRAFVVKPALQARQSVPLCNGEKQTKLILTADFDNIMEAFPSTSGQIDYCFLDKEIYDEKMKTASTQDDYVKAFDDALIRDTYGSTTTYGVLTFNTTFGSNPEYNSTTNYDGMDLNQATRYEVGSVRQLVFPSYAHDQKMLVGKDYIVAMVDHTGTAPGALSFEVNNVCSATSEFTVITSGMVKIDGQLASDQNGASVCANQIPVITIDMSGIGNLGEVVTSEAAYFDWYFGKKMATEYYKASPVLVTPQEPCKPRFTWMTDSQGNVVITISEGEGTPGETYFRNTGMNGIFKLDGDDFNSYFNKGLKDKYTYVLTLKNPKNKPANGSKISYSGQIECRSSKNTNDWSDYQFVGYTYSISDVECYDYESHNGTLLSEALDLFRMYYPKATEEQFGSCDPKEQYTQNHKDCIQHFLGKGKIALYKTSELLSTYDKYQEALEPDAVKEYNITAIPINPTPDRTDLKYCLEPFQITLTLSTRIPHMKNGDETIEYPTTMHVVPLRIGLEQLNRVRVPDKESTAAKKVLYMPLREVSPATDGVTSLIQMSEDRYIYLLASNDPQVLAGKSGAVPIENSSATIIGRVLDIQADINKHANYRGNVSQLAFIDDFKFREGYQYTIKFMFEENYTGVEGDHSDVCPGDVVCIIKVVPEYQMWTGKVSSNWNNDKNWRRVKKNELLGTAAATEDFTTDGGTNDNETSYVPADFTKVIIPAGADNVPKLYNVRAGDNLQTIYYSKAETESKFIKAMDAVSQIGDATEAINYDMSSIDCADKNVACRSWYDHTCQYIHFNSEAQMLSQQYLFYEKAWADFEVTPNKWSTVGSPLINVVSGDLYLPSDGARQNTPLFEDITFDQNKHDRFSPAVFQRRWNAENAKILHLDKHVTSAMVALDWSEVYNDVNVNYTSGVGFAIKPDVSMLPADKQPANVKFRLPKADKEYWYWNPGHQDGNVNKEAVRTENDSLINGERTHRLADLKNVYAQQVVQNNNSTNYFLIGNPLMCYLDMKRFFDANSNLERKYWIVTGKGQQYAEMDEKTEGYVGTVDNAYVAPFQSFFVKLKGTSSATFKPEFNSSMMVAKLSDGTYESVTAQQTSNPVKAYTMNICTTDERGNESTLLLTDGAELTTSGVEALFDSNLKMEGAPMVYTTQHGEAMSLTQILPGDTIPVAISGIDGNFNIALRGVDNFDTKLYLIDAEEGTSEPLTGDIELEQHGNGVRYYIAAEPTGIDESEIQLPQLITREGVLTVKIPAGTELTSVKVFRVDGILMASDTNVNAEYSVRLAPHNIYVVSLIYNGRSLTYKISL